jgi:hypothetical protein
MGQWVAGRYRVEIYIGDAPAINREFAIQKAIQAKPTNRPPSPKSTDPSRLAGPVKKN